MFLYLSRWLDSLDETETDDDPGSCQAQDQLPPELSIVLPGCVLLKTEHHAGVVILAGGGAGVNLEENNNLTTEKLNYFLSNLMLRNVSYFFHRLALRIKKMKRRRNVLKATCLEKKYWAVTIGVSRNILIKISVNPFAWWLKIENFRQPSSVNRQPSISP